MVMGEKEDISREALFNSIVESASQFYGRLVTVASAFLGGSLVFLERLSQHATPGSFVFLVLGWLFLVASIGLVVLVQRGNLESGRQALRGDTENASNIDRWTRRASSAAALFLVLGMSCLAAFGGWNIYRSKVAQEKVMSKVYETTKRGPNEDRDSIPYGDTPRIPDSKADRDDEDDDSSSNEDENS